MSNTDKIEKQVVLRAPRARVWRAISDAGEFGQWFKVKLDGPFVQGKSVHGNITHSGYEHLKFELAVERMEPERYFSYRWHPYAVDPKVDYSAEPTTLVDFRLEETAEATHLTIIESGFDRIPAARRDEAFRMNGHGWTAQIKNIENHVAGS